MRMILLVHIVAGGLGLLSGYLALSAAKGATLHRKIGLFFVCVMLTMSVTGMIISALGGVAPAINIPTALLTSYLVVTSLLTVRPPAADARRLAIAAMLAGLAIGVASVALAIAAIAGGGAAAGMAYPLFMFAAIAFAGSAGDRRMIRAGGLRGKPRLVRHLWRMCVALFLASIAFFGARGRVPEAINIPALRAAGVLLPIVVMTYWLWRLRRGRHARAISTPPAADRLTSRADLSPPSALEMLIQTNR
jgi:uncharacterized membrane protein